MAKNSKSEKNLEEAVIRISNHYNLANVIKRAFLQGIFTASGLFVGAILVFIIASQVLSGIKEIPLLDDFLRQSNLDVVIESQLNEISGERQNGEEQLVYEQNQRALTYSTINLESPAINLVYPNIFRNIETNPTQEGVNFILSEGDRIIEQILIYEKDFLEIAGNFYTEEVTSNEQIYQLKIYTGSLTVNNEIWKFGAIITDFEKDNVSYIIVAEAKENNLATSREIISFVIKESQL